MYLLRVLSFLKPYRWRMALALFSVFAATGFSLAMPQLIRWGIDYGIGGSGNKGDSSALALVAFAIIGAALMRGAFSFGQQYLGEWISQRVAYDLRNAIYNRLQRLSFAYHDKAQTGQLMSRATQDVESVRWYVQMGVIRFVYVIALLVVVLTIMLVSNWRLALVSWVFLPFIAWRSTSMAMSMRPLWLRVQNGLARLTTVLQEALTGARVVKAFGREQFENERFGREAHDLFDTSYKVSRVQALNGPLISGFSMLSLAVVLWYGGREVIADRLTIGELSAFLLYFGLLQMPVRSIGWIIMIFSRAGSSAQRIYEILDAESSVREKPEAVELTNPLGHVRFQGVSFSYDAISPVLREINIDARPGQVIALMGPSGSGKSTVVNLLPRFYDVTAGSVTIDGIDIRDLTLKSLREAIGIVQQDVFLFSATIRDNIAYGQMNANQEGIEAAAKAAQIHDSIMSFPDGYDTWVGERGITLSGGQKQRIAIARTLLLNPRILVLDDSTSSVDMETEYLIQRALAHLMENRTTFVIAQRLRTVQQADEIIVLDQGRIVERGRHEELVRQEGIYQQIYDLELRDQEEALRQPTLILPETTELVLEG